ncbi:hypothetical protein SOVF_196390 isoform B, partial [Spinacia oleracea]
EHRILRVSTGELGAARANQDNADTKDLKEQVSNLKAALAKKEEEMENLSRPLTSTPETIWSTLRGMRLMLVRKLMWFVSNGRSFLPPSIYY